MTTGKRAKPYYFLILIQFNSIHTIFSYITSRGEIVRGNNNSVYSNEKRSSIDDANSSAVQSPLIPHNKSASSSATIKRKNKNSEENDKNNNNNNFYPNNHNNNSVPPIQQPQYVPGQAYPPSPYGYYPVPAAPSNTLSYIDARLAAIENRLLFGNNNQNQPNWNNNNSNSNNNNADLAALLSNLSSKVDKIVLNNTPQV